MGVRLKPFIKWAGNKLPIIDELIEVLPKGRRLIEPFAGSGAVFLNTDYNSYVLADANRHLIDLHANVMADFSGMTTALEELFTPENNANDAYYLLRDEFNLPGIGLRKSALFIYLNRHCFNGLCRYNKNGGYNVPFGRYTNPYLPLPEMAGFADKARFNGVKLLHSEFEETIKQHATDGDVVYMDPPYAPLTPTANFTSYTSGGFGQKEQERLAELAIELQAKGIPTVISNHDTPFTRHLYRDASKIVSLDVQRYMAARTDCRVKAKELLACFYV